MNVNPGSVRLTRIALTMLMGLTLVLGAALAAPSQADAHQTAGRTLIYIDGELVKNTTDDHFTFERRLSPGCHALKVVQKRGGEVISRSIRRYCSEEPTRLIVTVDHGSVSSRTVARDNDTTSDDA